MQCPRCGFQNRDDARFCKRCGYGFQVLPLSTPSLCPACGATLKADARFCARCGQALAAQPSRQPAPQTVPAMVSPPVHREPPVTPAVIAPKPASSQQAKHSSGRWFWAFVAAALMFCMSCCAVLGLALIPSLSDMPPVVISGDPTGHDITIMVRESYLNRNLSAVLPNKGLKDATLDVQPDNLLVTTANFDLLFISMELRIVARLSIVGGEIHVSIEEVATGGRNLMELLGMDDITVGENFTRALREQLENELGEGSQLLDIITDEDHIILKARL